MHSTHYTEANNKMVTVLLNKQIVHLNTNTSQQCNNGHFQKFILLS